MTALRRDWIVWTGWAAALIAAGYAGLRLAAAPPAEGAPILYGLVLLYHYGALPASIVVMLAALTALFAWIPQAIVRAPRARRDGLLVALAVVAAGAAIWAALPLGRLIYRELDTVATASTSYHLGVILSSDRAQNAYSLCVCPGLVCTCHYFDDPSLRTASPAVPKLLITPDMRVVAHAGGRQLYVYTP